MAGADWSIRPATPSDVGFLVDVVIEVTRAQGRWPADFDEVDFRRQYEPWTRAQVRDESPDSTTSVIELAGEAVGRLRIVRDGDRIELAGIQLHPRVQGRGIGTGIIDDLKLEAASAGIALELSVEHDNPRARALYERLGFVKVSDDAKEARLRWPPDDQSSPRVDRASRVIAASPERIYRALVNPDALVAWLPPPGMSARFEHFAARPGGSYRLVLTYQDAETSAGKASADSDIVEARFVNLEPGVRVVQDVDFESDDPAYAGTMTMSWDITPVDGGALVEITPSNVPDGISAVDHAVGMASSLANLADHLRS